MRSSERTGRGHAALARLAKTRAGTETRAKQPASHPTHGRILEVAIEQTGIRPARHLRRQATRDS